MPALPTADRLKVVDKPGTPRIIARQPMHGAGCGAGAIPASPGDRGAKVMGRLRITEAVPHPKIMLRTR